MPDRLLLTVSRCTALVLALAVASADLWAQPPARAFPWKPREVKARRTSIGTVSIDVPEKDWQQLPGAGTVLATIAAKSGLGAVVIERSRLAQPLTSEDTTELLAELETDQVREREPGAVALRGDLDEHPTLGRVVRVRYARKGARGDEQVLQYSIPAGWDLYRIVYSAQAREFEKLGPAFERMILSLTIAPPPSAGR